MTAKQIWERITDRKPGDPTAEPLFLAIGRATSVWERLDTGQSFLFGTLVRSRHGAAERAYGLVTSPHTRAQMIITAAEAVITQDDALLGEILTAVETTKKLAGLRNDVAHGLVTHFSRSGNQGKKDFGHYLVPPLYNTKKIDYGALTRKLKEFSAAGATRAQVDEYFDSENSMLDQYIYAYTAEQVQEYISRFQSHYTVISDLLFKVQAYCDKHFPFPFPAPAQKA